MRQTSNSIARDLRTPKYRKRIEKNHMHESKKIRGKKHKKAIAA